jgi:hypothetical protein
VSDREILRGGLRVGLILSLIVPQGTGRGSAPEVLLWLRPPGFRRVAELLAWSDERNARVDDAKSMEDGQKEHKRWLIKAARMYAMCQKAGVSDPMDVTGLAVAAFEDMPLTQALVFVRSNEQNIEDLAWAFSNSSTAEEFEQRIKEIKYLPDRSEDPPT